MIVKEPKHVKAYREEQCLTQVQLAEKLNVSSRTVESWECGGNTRFSRRSLKDWEDLQKIGDLQKREDQEE